MTDSRIGLKIRRRRQELGWTQQELAERIGVDRASIINWEKGRHVPIRHEGAIELALGIRLSEDEGPDEPDPVNPERELSDKELAERLGRISDEMARRAEERARRRRKGDADGSYRRRAG